MLAVNQCGVICQPLAMVCPACVDLKLDGYCWQTLNYIPDSQETENRSDIMFQHTVIEGKKGERNL